MEQGTGLKSSEQRLAEFRQRRERALASSRDLRDAIAGVVDDGSLTEVDIFATIRTDDATAQDVGADAGVAGLAECGGRPVAVFAFHTRSLAGDLADVVAQKVVKAQQIALNDRVPLVGYVAVDADAPAEDLVALGAWAAMFGGAAELSGSVPQLCIIKAEATPPPQVLQLAALFDFVVDAPSAQRLLSYLPSSFDDMAPFEPLEDGADDFDAELQNLLPVDGAGSSGREVLRHVTDGGSFVDLGAPGSPLVMGVARIGGLAAGVLASDGAVNDGALDAPTLRRAARFVRFFDAFGIPIVSLVDSPGLAGAGLDEAISAAQLLYSFADASVPKVTVITGRALGAAFASLASKQLGADLVCCWPTADVGPSATTAGHHLALERGLVDEVIEPAETRRVLRRALELTLNKTVEVPLRKHGNWP